MTGEGRPSSAEKKGAADGCVGKYEKKLALLL